MIDVSLWHRTSLTSLLILVAVCVASLQPAGALFKGRCPYHALDVSASRLHKAAPGPSPFSTWQEGAHHKGLTCRSLRSKRFPAFNASTLAGIVDHRPGPASPLPPPPDLPHCPKLTFSTPVEGSFSSGPLGPTFHLSTCKLRQFTADGALRCLAGKRVVWLGDSVTRYQAVSFAHWLGNGAYQHPFDDAVPQHLPSVTNEHTWPDWATYYTDLSKELTQPGCMTASCPGCYRDNDTTAETWNWNFTLASGSSFTMASQTILSYPSVDTVALDALAWALAGPLKPDVLIFNVGIWLANVCLQDMPISAILNIYEALFQSATALVAAQSPPRTHMVFKSTTPFRPDLNQVKKKTNGADVSLMRNWQQVWQDLVEPMVKRMAVWYGFDYYDIASVARTGIGLKLHAMWDKYHFYPYMYQQFNDLLLNVLC